MWKLADSATAIIYHKIKVANLHLITLYGTITESLSACFSRAFHKQSGIFNKKAHKTNLDKYIYK